MAWKAGSAARIHFVAIDIHAVDEVLVMKNFTINRLNQPK